MYRLMIVDQDYDFAQQFIDYTAWADLGVNIIDIEYNPSVGLEKFYVLKPDILLLGDSYFYMNTSAFIKAIEHVDGDFKIVCLTSEPLEFPVSEHQRILFALHKQARVQDHQELTDAVKHVCQILEKERAYTIERISSTGFSQQKNRFLCQLMERNALLTKRAIREMDLDLQGGPAYMLMGKGTERDKISFSHISHLYHEVKELLGTYGGGELFITEDEMLFIIFNDFLKDQAEGFHINIVGFNELVENLAELVCSRIHSQFHFYLSEKLDGFCDFSKWKEKLIEFSAVSYFEYDKRLLYYKKEERNFSTEDLYRLEFLLAEVSQNILTGNFSAVCLAVEEAYYTRVKPLHSMEALRFVQKHVQESMDIACLVNRMEAPKLYGEAVVFDSLEEEVQHVLSMLDELMGKIRGCEINTLVIKALSYMLNHYDRDISQAELADEMGISAAYLSRLFKKTTGENFSNVLNTIRIQKAKDLLLFSEHKVFEIAKAVGFNNVKYFNKVFKCFTGSSPSQFAAVQLDMGQSQDV